MDMWSFVLAHWAKIILAIVVASWVSSMVSVWWRTRRVEALVKAKRAEWQKLDTRLVWVVGCAGAGKSTAAFRLGHSLGNTAIDLDDLYWLPGWQKRKGEEVRELLTELFDAGPVRCLGRHSQAHVASSVVDWLVVNIARCLCVLRPSWRGCMKVTWATTAGSTVSGPFAHPPAHLHTGGSAFCATKSLAPVDAFPAASCSLVCLMLGGGHVLPSTRHRHIGTATVLVWVRPPMSRLMWQLISRCLVNWAIGRCNCGNGNQETLYSNFFAPDSLVRKTYRKFGLVEQRYSRLLAHPPSRLRGNILVLQDTVELDALCRVLAETRDSPPEPQSVSLLRSLTRKLAGPMMERLETYKARKRAARRTGSVLKAQQRRIEAMRIKQRARAKVTELLARHAAELNQAMREAEEAEAAEREAEASAHATQRSAEAEEAAERKAEEERRQQQQRQQQQQQQRRREAAQTDGRQRGSVKTGRRSFDEEFAKLRSRRAQTTGEAARNGGGSNKQQVAD